MKISNLIMTSLLSACLLPACSSDDENVPEIEVAKDVVFTSSISGLQSRVNDSTWNNNDEIGIYMQTKSTEVTNKKYLAQTDGTLKAAPGNELRYPMEGTSSFLAYYPYTSTLTDKNVTVSVANQTEPSKLDFLYANNAKNIKQGQTVNLIFHHQLSKIVINIQKDETIKDTKGVTIKLSGMNTSATFNLADGSLKATDSKADIQMNVNAEGTTADAIVLPAASVEGMKMEFKLGDKEFEWPVTIKDNKGLEAGCKYTFTATLSVFEDQPTLSMGNAVITDWTDKESGNIDVDFGGEDKPAPKPDPTPDPEPNPDPEPDPQPIEGAVLFNETFGNPKKDGKYWPALNTYTGWTDTHKMTYSDPLLGGNSYSTASVRATSTMDGHVWFAAKKNSALKVEGFDTASYKTIQLMYQIAANLQGTSGNQNAITVSTDKGEVTVPATAITESNKYQTVTLNLPTGFTYLQFTSKADVNLVGYRIDNIKVIGSTK